MGIVFGMIARMMLLRWKRGLFVGLVLSALVATAIVLGISIRRATEGPVPLEWPWQLVFPAIFVYSCGTVLIGALIVWPIWVILVRAFLPNRTSQALLTWQRSLSNSVSRLARAGFPRWCRIVPLRPAPRYRAKHATGGPAPGKAKLSWPSVRRTPCSVSR